MPEERRKFEEKKKQAIQYIEDVTEKADELQQQVLSEILTRNANVEYLHRHGLHGRIDTETFKKMIPVVGYEDLQPYITRIANGDSSPILCSSPISEFLTSSGTSRGERKLMPTIEEELDRRSLLYSLLIPVISQFIPELEQGKGLYFLFTKSESKTPGGYLARPVLTSYYKSSHFITQDDPYTNYTSPKEAILCSDSYQSMYAQVLSGLSERSKVNRVGAVFASGFIRSIRFLQDHWSVLCNDIRTGVVDARVTDKAVREALGRILKPDPDSAHFVEEQCKGKGGSFEGIIPRLWPNTKYVDVIVTGTMSQYIPTLDYYSNNLPIVCTMYASSECYFGINLNPLCNPVDVSYTLLPTMAYFEFLSTEKEEVLDLVDVEMGKEYELVVTTYAGLYRYRVGDVLRVSGFKNKAPQFKFICRKNVVLSIDSDKTDEVELQTAVGHAVSRHLSPLNISVTDYTSHADTSTIPGHYVLYFELKPDSPVALANSSLFEDCCLAVEDCLNSVYRQGRVVDRSIGPMEIRIVESGTFDKLMDYAIGLGASINQYKTPRCVTFTPMVELLNSRVLGSYSGRKCPRWGLRGSPE